MCIHVCDIEFCKILDHVFIVVAPFFLVTIHLMDILVIKYDFLILACQFLPTYDKFLVTIRKEDINVFFLIILFHYLEISQYYISQQPCGQVLFACNLNFRMTIFILSILQKLIEYQLLIPTQILKSCQFLFHCFPP